MEDRYEIRGKIGQGGLGSVYKGFDTRMNREVAVKRISGIGLDADLQSESTRQLLKEAGTLASLQHPNIVTVYDVGADEDGPYVVMELITGSTIDALIERAPLTWLDFRELAMQTQEALIAAHELNFVHSDIKPSNLMLSWLPSGKFQVKILDFGLTTMVKSQTHEELAALESIFGSISFMPPEQFERKPLDFRSDIYSMGCVYYHALSGAYPFDGATGEEVMAAHLNHTVIPLHEIRSDIPRWVCDWVMWQINRFPEDRPDSVRDSLSLFVRNDRSSSPTTSLGTAPPQKRSRLIIPGSQAADHTPAAAAEPAPPAPVTATPPATKPLQATPPSTGPLMAARQANLPPDPVDSPPVPKTKTAPQPLSPPAGSKPSVHTSPHDQPLPAPAPALSPATASAPLLVPLHAASPAPPAAKTQPGTAASGTPTAGHPKSKGLSNTSKTTIAAILGIVVILLAWIIIDRIDQNKDTQLYNEMVSLAAKDDTKEVPVNSHKLDILLNAAASVGKVEGRAAIYTALVKAKAVDNTDVEARILQFGTRKELLSTVRVALLRDVLRYRKNPSIVAPLLAYAKSTDQKEGAIAAVEASRPFAGEEHIEPLIGLLRATKDESLRRAAEETLTAIVKRSQRRADLAARFAPVYQASQEDPIRHAMLRLCGACGGPAAMETIKGALTGNEAKDKLPAMAALAQWPDDSSFPVLAGFLESTSDPKLRDKAMDAMISGINDGTTRPQPAERQEQWARLKTLAKGRAEHQKIIRELVKNFTNDWAIQIIEDYTKSEDEAVAELAYRGVDFMKNNKANQTEP